MINSAKTAILLLVCGFLASCALPSYRTHPAFETTAKRIGTVTLLPPQVEVFYLETGGVREKRDEWSDQAKKNISVATEEGVSDRITFKIKSLPESHLSDEVKSEIEETYALFDMVSFSILLHTYPQAGVLFEEKVKNFEYSLGEEVKRLKVEGADALLLLSGSDHVWSEGRKGLQAFAVLLGLGAAAGTGVMVIPVLGGGTQITAALLDAHSGTILWYNRVAAGAGYDLRDRESATELVKKLFEGFPTGKGEQ